MPGQRRLDRILDASYLDAVAQRTTDEVRRMRDECEEEESGISFARRVLQGRLDILRADALRRQRESGDSEDGSLLAALPTILSDDPPVSMVRARVTRFLVPPSVQYHRREVERLVDEEVLAHVSDRSTAELSELVARLAAKEVELSAVRRELLARLDRLQEELTRRYREGEADVREVLPRLA